MTSTTNHGACQIKAKQIRHLRKYLTIVSLVAWISHYLYRVRKVRLHRCLTSASKQHERLNNIVSRCPTLHSTYWPTWYAPTAMLQFVVLACKEFRARFLQKAPYRRQFLNFPNGACIALDWITAKSESKNKSANLSSRNGKELICVLLHGAFQDSSSATMIDLGCGLASKGLPVVIVNRRGYGGLGLTGPPSARRVALYGFDEDLDAALDEVYRAHPGCDVALVGFSCGAAFAARYASKRVSLSAWSEPTIASAQRAAPRIVCTALLDSAHCVHSCVGKVRPPFTWIMNWGLKFWYGFAHRRSLQQVSDEFSEAVVRITNPFTSLVETYSALQVLSGAKNESEWIDLQQPRLADINVPSLLINSRDDPMARWENTEQHQESITSNPNLVLAELHCGAHFCKYNFSGADSIADAMISEFVLSSWHELYCQQKASCQEESFPSTVCGA